MNNDCFKKHWVRCKNITYESVIMPPLETGRAPRLRFSRCDTCIRFAVVLHEDLETKPAGGQEGKHRAMSARYRIVSGLPLEDYGVEKDWATCCSCDDEELVHDCASKRPTKQLFNIAEGCIHKALGKESKKYKDVESIQVNDQENEAYATACSCYVCGKAFDNETGGMHKVRDHSHCTGRFRGAAHSRCNLNTIEQYQQKREVVENPRFLPQRCRFRREAADARRHRRHLHLRKGLGKRRQGTRLKREGVLNPFSIGREEQDDRFRTLGDDRLVHAPARWL